MTDDLERLNGTKLTVGRIIFAPPPASTLAPSFFDVQPKVPLCRFCGKPADHPITRCPMVRAVEFYGDGQVRRVELVR